MAPAPYPWERLWDRLALWWMERKAKSDESGPRDPRATPPVRAKYAPDTLPEALKPAEPQLLACGFCGVPGGVACRPWCPRLREPDDEGEAA